MEKFVNNKSENVELKNTCMETAFSHNGKNRFKVDDILVSQGKLHRL